jgi:quinone-modifying oxidoreductase subunit QmoA
MYIREQYPDSKITIYYIDIRTPGLYEPRFYWKIKEDPNVTFIKGKVAGITEGAGGDVVLEVEDIYAGAKKKGTFDMVVLATGMEVKGAKFGTDVPFSADGLVDDAALKKGMYAVGTMKSPADVARSVQDATAAAIKSIQSVNRR